MRRGALRLAVVMALFTATACMSPPGPHSAPSPSSTETPVNQPSIDDAMAKMYEIADAVAADLGGTVELVSDDRQTCDAMLAGPKCPGGGSRTHVMQIYRLRVSPTPKDFDAIVAEKVMPRFPSDKGWSAKKRDSGNEIEYYFWHYDGSAFSVFHGVGEGTTTGVTGYTSMVPVRPGDLDRNGFPVFTSSHTPSPQS